MGDAPLGGLVGVAVAPVVADHDVGGLVEALPAGVDNGGEVRALHDLLAPAFVVADGLELALQPGEELVCFRARLHDALGLPALEVEVQAVEAHAVGRRLRPVHGVGDEDVLEAAGVLGELLRAALVQDQVAVLQEPGVEAELAPVGGEAVVRHDHDDRVVSHAVEDLPEEGVHLEVEVVHHVAPGGAISVRPPARALVRDRLVEERVLGVLVAPHHVHGEVHRGDVEEEQAAIVVRDVAVQRVVQHAGPLQIDQLRLSHELGVGEGAVLEGGDLLGHALGVIVADRRREVRGGLLGKGDRVDRRYRIEVDRRGVEHEVRADATQVEAHDTPEVHGAHGRHLEAHAAEA